MLFTEVVQCRYAWKWIVRARKHCRGRWNHVDIVFHYQIITTSGIRPPFWTSACRKRPVRFAYKPVKTRPKNIGIAFEIASICDSVAKLLVLPVWATISTSVLYLMAFCIVGRCRRRWKWFGLARKLYRSRWDHVELSSRRLVITTSGFGGFLLPVCKCSQEKSALESLAWMHMKTWIKPLYFFHLGTPNPRYAWNQFFTIWHLGVLFVSHQNLGDSKEIWEKFFWGSVANKYLGSHGSVPKNSKQFRCSGEKTGSGG